MNPTPLVTILTPTFNRREFLSETIDSVVEQDYPNLEHLVLDDGSTDGTPDLLHSYRNRFPERFRWVRHANVGQPKTINRGFDLAKGTLLGIVNSDDTLLPGAIRRLVQVLVDTPQALAVYPDFKIVDEAGTELHTVRQLEYSFEEMVRLQENLVGAGALFRRTLVDRIGGWDPAYKLAADFDFWLRGALIGSYLHLPEVLATWREHADSATVTGRGYEMARERLRLVDAFFSRSDLPNAIRAVHDKAYRAMFCICGVLIDPSNDPRDNRHLIFDRLSTRVAPELAPSDPEAAVFWLHGEVAARDARIRALEETVEAQVERIARIHAGFAERNSWTT